MHKVFYASGFLYHSPTQQILLQQSLIPNSSNLWSLIGEKNYPGKTAQVTFQRTIHKLLKIKLVLASIESVYNYFHQESNTDNSVMYAHIQDIRIYPSGKLTSFAWFTFKQIHKLPMSEQIRQDITVAQRVIDAKTRKRLGQQTLE